MIAQNEDKKCRIYFWILYGNNNWTRDGQHFHRAAVADREIRRGVLERLRRRPRRVRKLEKLFSLLQFPTAPSVVGQSDARCGLLWEKRGEVSKNHHTPDRLCGRSSFIGHLGTTLFLPGDQNKDAASRRFLLMSFKRHQEIYPNNRGVDHRADASAHRLDEFPTGYSL